MTDDERQQLGEALQDPMAFKEFFWPKVTFYDRQIDAIYSVVENDETFVPAGNMLGKDFVAGFIALYFFLTRSPCRIVVTSAKEDHLRVLFGEINRFIRTAEHPLDADEGGCLICKHNEIEKFIWKEDASGRVMRDDDGNLLPPQKCPLSYIKGLVAGPGSIAAMQGHHIAKTGDGVPRTLFISDESSSVEDDYWRMASTWMNRALVIGNPWPCVNFFFKGVEEGDKYSADGSRCYRKVIQIGAEDSPNVKLGLEQKRRGLPITNEMLIPGVKDYAEYEKNLATWDAIQIEVSVHGRFYKGKDVLMFPREWLLRARTLDLLLRRQGKRQALAIGIDPAEGGDKTAMAAVDTKGLIELVSRKTPNTADITTEARDFMHKHGVPPEMVVFDAGGGGKQHRDRMAADPPEGYGMEGIRTVAFGETLGLTPKRGLTMIEDRIDIKEERSAYVNRRAEMYGTLRNLLDPSLNPGGFALPLNEHPELYQQLSVIPLLYDAEGRMLLLPKNRRGDVAETGKQRKTLVELIGHSPDEADATVLAVYAMMNESVRTVAGAIR